MRNNTTGVTVTLNQLKLEVGTVTTAWSPSPNDTTNSLGDLSTMVQGFIDSLDPKIQEQIKNSGFTTKEELVKELNKLDIDGLVGSKVTEAKDSITTEFSKLGLTEDGIGRI